MSFNILMDNFLNFLLLFRAINKLLSQNACNRKLTNLY
jgi:hypothetical protein